MNTRKIVAHRGDNTNFPENSYAGIEAALKAGALLVEFDIQMNKDGVFLVIHDDDFKRTSNTDLSVFEVSNNDISSISVHHPVKTKEKHYPTPVPLLTDVMRLFKEYPESRALVEIKNQSIKRWGLKKIMKTLLYDLKDFVSQSIIIGYSDEALNYAKKHSNHQTGLVFNQYSDTIRKTAYELKPDFMICPYDIIPEKSVWKGLWQWMVYSINDMALAKKVLQRKDIDFIETDNIQLLLQTD